jgi:hypothetical protein
MTPSAACARTSATSKSSIRCTRARSSTMARIAALEIIGVIDAELLMGGDAPGSGLARIGTASKTHDG